MDDLKRISDADMNKMLSIYEDRYNYGGSVCVSTRKDGLISVYGGRNPKMLFDDRYEEVVQP